MGKSSKKAAAPAWLPERRKRDAEHEIEKAGSAKQQMAEAGAAAPAPVPKPRKRDAEELIEKAGTAKKQKAAAANTVPPPKEDAKKSKKQQKVSKEKKLELEDEIEKAAAPAPSKAAPVAKEDAKEAKKQKEEAKKQEEDAKNSKKQPPTKEDSMKAKKQPPPKKAESSSSSSEESMSEDEEAPPKLTPESVSKGRKLEVEDKIEKTTALVPSTAAPVAKEDSKKLQLPKADSSSGGLEKFESKDEMTAAIAKDDSNEGKQVNNTGESSSDYESDDDNEAVSTGKKLEAGGAPACSSGQQSSVAEPKIPVNTQSHATGSKFLRLSNMGCRTEFDDVKEFFEDVAEVIDVDFPTLDNGISAGHCYVEFVSVEDANKALKMNGKMMLDRCVKLAPEYTCRGQMSAGTVSAGKIIYSSDTSED